MTLNKILMFMKTFIDFFFYPLKQIDILNPIWAIVITVLIVLIVVTFVRRLFSCVHL